MGASRQRAYVVRANSASASRTWTSACVALSFASRGNELCVELRGLDLGQDLPLTDMVADIDVPFRDIPGYARVDRAFVPRVRLAGQCQTRPARCRPDRDRVDHGRRRSERSRLAGEGVRGDEP